MDNRPGTVVSVVTIDKNINVEDNLDKEPTKESSALLGAVKHETVKSK